MWAFMKAFTWDSIKSDYKIQFPRKGEGQPQRFIPVFDLKKDALKFAGKEKDSVVKLDVIETNEVITEVKKES